MATRTSRIPQKQKLRGYKTAAQRRRDGSIKERSRYGDCGCYFLHREEHCKLTSLRSERLLAGTVEDYFDGETPFTLSVSDSSSTDSVLVYSVETAGYRPLLVVLPIRPEPVARLNPQMTAAMHERLRPNRMSRDDYRDRALGRDLRLGLRRPAFG